MGEAAVETRKTGGGGLQRMTELQDRIAKLLLISPEPSPEGYHLLRVKPGGVAVSRYAAVRRAGAASAGVVSWRY
ncbi:unnamed protein product [Arctogadus glacialis]